MPRLIASVGYVLLNAEDPEKRASPHWGSRLAGDGLLAGAVYAANVEVWLRGETNDLGVTPPWKAR
jgi:hypothetical protein